MIKRYLVAGAALPLLFACAPSGSNNQATAQQAPSAATPSMTVQQAAQAFGLIGSWADDCNQPTSQANERETYALEADGTVSLVYDGGPGVVPNRYSWNQALLVDPNTLQIDGIFYGDNLAQHTVLQKNSAGQLRVFGNVDGSGKVLVANGAFPDGGAPGWVNKCS